MLFAGALAVLLAGCSAQAGTDDHREVVVYEVGGDYSFASYDDEYENGIEYPPGVKRVELRGEDVPQPPKPLYTWANTSEGRVSEAWCTITVDGEVVARDRKVGEANDPMCLYPTP